MSKKARSARGEVVDFDLLAIKQQLSAIPPPISVKNRRRFIDERDGLKARGKAASPASPAAPTAEALSLAAEAALASSTAKKRSTKKAAD